MRRKLVKFVFYTFLIILLAYLAVKTYSVIGSDSKARLHYAVFVEENDFIKEVVYVESNDTVKLVVIYNDGTVLEKKLPAYIAEHENIHGAAYFCTILFATLAMFVFILWCETLIDVIINLKVMLRNVRFRRCGLR